MGIAYPNTSIDYSQPQNFHWLEIKRVEGKVKEIYFEISKNTQITPQELANLETLIKQTHFPQPSNVCQEAEYLIRNLVIEFKDL